MVSKKVTERDSMESMNMGKKYSNHQSGSHSVCMEKLDGLLTVRLIFDAHHDRALVTDLFLKK